MSDGSTRIDMLREDVLSGRMDRRELLRRATAMGLSAPVIAGLLVACGGDDDDEPTTGVAGATPPATPSPTVSSRGQASTSAASPPASQATSTTAPEVSPTSKAETTPTGGSAGQGRGVGDLLRILYWQAPVILNPHFSQGNKDSSAASLILEPLIDIDADGNIIPVLIAEVPSLENGDVAEDGMSVTYRLLPDVVWSDGEPFTAEDVRFTWQFITDPASNATTTATYEVIDDIEVVDPTTVTVRFAEPNPAWFNPFSTGFGGQILPRHILQNSMGEAGRNAEFNLSPIGTGPYKLVEFNPGDVITYEINESYREPDKPYFKRVEFKGGGDAVSAARSALESGETDWAWNLQIEASILESFADSNAGMLLSTPGSGVERIVLNFADPNTEVNGARSEPSTKHPFLSDLNVRQAFALATDRETITNELYGRAGTATANLLVAPTIYNSPNTSFTFDLAAAAAKLDEAGWVLDGNRRVKDGVEMSVLFQAAINSVRQKTQDICKQSWEQLGIATELKAIDPSVLFSSDPGNPDTYSHFYADFQMDTNGPSSPYPLEYLALYKSDNPNVDLAQQSNQWSGSNANRWVNEQFNQLFRQARTELDPNTQVELFIGMNDLIVNEVVDIALVHRANVSAANRKLKGYSLSPWSPNVRDIANWYFEEE